MTRLEGAFKETLNEVLRRWLSGQTGVAGARPFTVEPHPSSFRPGIDHQRLNQLVDHLTAGDLVDKAGG